jgi:hypothetical protein
VKRALAVVAAVTMVVGSLLLRSRLDDTSGGGNGGNTKVVLACVTELADACNALAGANVEIRIADAGTTSKSVSGIDGWVTLDPWPEIAGLSASPVRVASSPLVIAAVAERAAVLQAHCGGTIGWKCLGDAIESDWASIGGQPEWGKVRVGIPSVKTATGLLLIGNATAGYFGRPDVATNDFDVDDGFLAWFAKLKRAPQPADPFPTFIQQFPASFSAVGVIEAKEAAGVGVKPVTVVNPSPQASAVVVVAPVNPSTEGRVRTLARSAALRDALKAQGWNIDAVPTNSGLPGAGVLLALSTR